MADKFIKLIRLWPFHDLKIDRFLFRDDFTTDESAPLSSPRVCEPGPGTFAIVLTSMKDESQPSGRQNDG